VRVASRIADFNYKVALASGLKSLQGGRLRQAEEQFRYLVQKFPSADGGYRGLAKVLIEQEDRTAALRTLLDGGAALAKADQRASAVALYREAVALTPTDHGAHRRLAAALLNSGETDEAAHEFVRFIKEIRGIDAERAKTEAEYAFERLPNHSEIKDVARLTGAPTTAHVTSAPPVMEPTTPDDRAALLRSAFGTPPSAQESSTPSAASSSSAASAWDAPVAASQPAADPWGASAPAHELSAADPWSTDGGITPAESGTPVADHDEQSVEANAARYLASGDSRGAEHALEAARRYIADGRVDAASDLLLQLIAAGVATHDAQRLLIDVAKSLGKKDVARAKVQLLVEMLKLEGRTDLAAEVEQLAQAF
jgi:thioredoxin-like negative regulator of GroEL